MGNNDNREVMSTTGPVSDGTHQQSVSDVIMHESLVALLTSEKVVEISMRVQDPMINNGGRDNGRQFPVPRAWKLNPGSCSFLWGRTKSTESMERQ